MKVVFVDDHRGEAPVDRLRRIMEVSPRGYRSWRSRSMSASKRQDMVALAQIREQFALSPESHGRLRMTEELKESGLEAP